MGDYNQLRQYVHQLMNTNGYTHIPEASSDAANVIRHYPDLKPKDEMFTFNNGSRRKLVHLVGTIPVRYRGASYNIPVGIYLMNTHPHAAPLCFVKPTPTMQVKPGKHVDMNGRVYLPYLNEWRPGQHDLTGLVQVMTIVFGEEPPVVSRPTQAPPQRAPYPGVNPPYPQPGPGYPPRGPPSTTYQPANPPYPMGTSHPPYPTNANSAYPPHNATPYPSYPNAMYPPGPAQPPPGQNTPYPANPVTNKQSQLSDDMVKASLKSAVNDKLKRRMREAHSQAESEMSSLKQTEKELKDGQVKIQSIIEKLESETAQVDRNIMILESKNKEIEEKIEAMQNKQDELDVDEVVLPTTPLYKQILESFAEEQALEDTIYYLGEGLRKGSVDLDAFLKHVRALSRQQFTLRATIKKARTTAGLAVV
ncbi:tumor susceptibility gene 101 protein-like [Styela clava]|uniref:tumor susceptibility gene 101 protein-like n=1 Tax=Styela clava TaxID=7725 RepID=UPI001939E332|nr:tumor susceptibility gene 101 protein-like [Styela clava]